MSVLKILHFADAHIDMANFGRHDPETGLPVRVMDFLKSLDEIVDAAIKEKVDMVIFAGDAYKDRNPAPTYQREWGRRIMRLSKAGIPTLLLVGNHDLSPSLGRAHALEEYATLEVPHIHVLDEPSYLGPEQLENLPLQVIALPWLTRSGMMAKLSISATEPSKIYEELEERLTELVNHYLDDEVDAELPTILVAHASVQGASYGGERTVMLGNDLVLSGSLVKDKRLDYVALGHIHKKQNLNEGQQPPVIYPGSIERVDFGEARDDKFFVIVELEKGNAQLVWRQLKGIRPFIDIPPIHLDSQENINQRIQAALPSAEKMEGAILRLTLEYPREWEALIDDASLRELTANTFEFHLVKRPKMDSRIRIPEDQQVSELSPYELLDLYWKSAHVKEAEIDSLTQLAKEIIDNANIED
jgi:exonuclease SbcD